MSAMFSGGCQCGAVRFQASDLGRPSICHCRMCQKAFGGFFSVAVGTDAAHVTWTRGEPSLFKTSENVFRGFCRKCGTPLSYHHDGGIVLSIGAFDNPENFEPQVQLNHGKRLPWIDQIFEKPAVTSPEMEAVFAAVESYQHPDHDTAEWPPETSV